MRYKPCALNIFHIFETRRSHSKTYERDMGRRAGREFISKIPIESKKTLLADGGNLVFLAAR